MAVWPPFVHVSLWLTITAGFGLGGALFAAQAMCVPIGLWWLAAAQQHGHIQLFGWAGLMVLSVGFIGPDRHHRHDAHGIARSGMDHRRTGN
jgi:hypothetical protein